MNTFSDNKVFNPKNIIILILLILSVILGILYMSKNSRINQLIGEKEKQRQAFRSELDSLLTEHHKVKEEYGSLTLQLAAKDSIIQANATEIKKLLDTEWEYYRVQKKLTQLRNISQGYLKQIDSLYTVNKELKEENVQIRASYEREKMVVRDLQKDKEALTEKVESAAMLRAYGIEATGISASGGRGRELATDRARRTDKIKVCFTLAENPVLQPGTKEIFLRIARPDNRILTKGLGDEYSFMYKGEVLQYTSKISANYQNASINLCTEWIHRNDKDPVQAGLYVVTIFAEDQEIGQTYFELK